MIEAVLGALFEFFLQLIGELILDLITRAIGHSQRPPALRSPGWAFCGYILLGLLFGAVSLLLFPFYFITSPTLQVVNLFGSALISGLVMAAVGKRARRRGQSIRLESFFYGFVFAFSMAFVRYAFCDMR